MSKPIETTCASASSVALPPDMAEKILWSPPFPDFNVPESPDGQPSDDAPTSPPTFAFSDGILSEAHALTSYAFSRAVQMACSNGSISDKKEDTERSCPEPIISLYYPHDGCHDIIDSMVKRLASEQGADVVVLDSLEFALGESGAFGKDFAHAIDILYGVPSVVDPSAANPCDDDTVQRVFNDIVNIRRETDALREDEDSVDQANSRIVYMRDFGSIAPSALPFISYLMRALHARRTAEVDKGLPECARSFRPTVLILGFANSKPKGDNAHSPWNSRPSYNAHDKVAKDIFRGFSENGEALTQILPTLDNELFTLGNIKFPVSPFSSTFFLASLVDIGHLNAHDIALKATTIDIILTSLNLSVFPKDSRTDEFRQVEQRMACSRRQAVRNGWITVCLRGRGAIVYENPLGSIEIDGFQMSAVGDEHPANPPGIPEVVGFLDVFHKHTGFLLPVALDQIATIALGFSSPPESYKSIAAILVTPAAVSRACRLFIENWRARSDWFKAVKKSREDDQKADNDDLADDGWGNGGWGNGGWGGNDSWGPANDGRGSANDGRGSANDRWGSVNDDWGDNSSWGAEKKKKKKTKKKAEQKDESLDPVDPIEKVKGAPDLTSYERNLLSCIVDSTQLETTFKDVCIQDKLVESLRTIISLPLLHPTAFKTGILGREAIGGILLYGPPGTGKTLVCRALSRECGARLLQVKPSDIMDIYLGESEKAVKALFSLAYRLAPCVIFIDEVESLFKARKGDDKKWYGNILNEFLQSMDGLQSAKMNKDKGIVVVGATNRPYDLDDAVIRRLATRIMVDLPGEKEREQILRLHLKDETLGEDVILSHIASRTLCYSGSDLKNLCVSAAMASVKDAIDGFSWTPVIPSETSASVLEQAETSSATDGAESKIHTRTITLAHFKHAINEVSASSSLNSHSDLYRWHGQFGHKRALL